MSALTREIRECLRESGVRDKDAFWGRFVFPAGFSGFKGHFDGNPVLPGVCMVRALLVAREACGRPAVSLTSISSAKWYVPVKPGEELEIAARERENGSLTAQIRARVSRGGQKVADLVLDVARSDGGTAA